MMIVCLVVCLALLRGVSESSWLSPAIIATLSSKLLFSLF